MTRKAWLLALACLLPASGQARDERLLFDIASALRTPEAVDRLDDTVQFFWGEQPYPPAQQMLGVHTTSRRIWALNKSDQEACDGAFLSAVVALRDRAKELGGDAVVEIKSLYKNREFRSETQYECRGGYVVSGVSLEGRIVKLPPPGPSAVPLPTH